MERGGRKQNRARGQEQREQCLFSGAEKTLTFQFIHKTLRVTQQHVGKGHLRADREGVPVQAHLHHSSRAEPLPLCQCHSSHRLEPTGSGASMAAD
ncbi:hypothetical protein PDJAM_G00043490 [Pangasius djambal]|uniref:Uncharacterized protein n=1 Tax=Pangasius djambal TaxID=1691987 RepID=A0ACC5YUN0_9TELE|nr:hypothetical protein [Pangasius djambal]